MLAQTFQIIYISIFCMIDKVIFTGNNITFSIFHIVKLTCKCYICKFAVSNAYARSFIVLRSSSVITSQLFNHPLSCRHMIEVLFVFFYIIIHMSGKIGNDIWTVYSLFTLASCFCCRQTNKVSTVHFWSTSQIRVIVIETDTDQHISLLVSYISLTICFWINSQTSISECTSLISTGTANCRNDRTIRQISDCDCNRFVFGFLYTCIICSCHSTCTAGFTFVYRVIELLSCSTCQWCCSPCSTCLVFSYRHRRSIPRFDNQAILSREISELKDRTSIICSQFCIIRSRSIH